MPVLQPDYKIFEMNKRLQHRNEDSDNLWWDAFANEFFDDEAQVTLTFCLEDGPKRYSKPQHPPSAKAQISSIDRIFSGWSDIDPEVLPEHLRGRRDRPSLGAQTLEGIISSECGVSRL